MRINFAVELAGRDLDGFPIRAARLEREVGAVALQREGALVGELLRHDRAVEQRGRIRRILGGGGIEMVQGILPSAALQLNQAEPVQGLGVAGVNLQRGAETPFRIVESLPVVKGGAETDPAIGCRRLEQRVAAELLDGPSQVLLVQVDAAILDPGRDRPRDMRVLQVDLNQPLQFVCQFFGAFRRDVEREGLDGYQPIGLGVVRAKHGSQDPGANLMQESKSAEGRRRRVRGTWSQISN